MKRQSALVLSILFLTTLLIMGCIGSEEDDGGGFGSVDNTRGWAWVRNNPMLISGLKLSMGSPPASFVNSYFNGFYANAAHLWQDGVPFESNGWLAAGAPRFVSWLANDGTSYANGLVIGGYPADQPGRIGYQVGDEPSRECPDYGCALNTLMDISNGINAVRAADPNALIYVNFKKSDWQDDLLRYYCENMDGDIISYDHYTYGDSAYHQLATFRNYGLTYSKPYWRFLRSYNWAGSPQAVSESDMRWQAFVGLVYGYTGHSWFIYNISDKNLDHDPVSSTLFNGKGFNSSPTNLWNTAARINAEMANLGRSMTQLQSTDVRYVRSSLRLLPGGTQDWAPGAGGDPYITSIEAKDNNFLELLVGFFKDGNGEIYFMVQNVAHAHGRAPLNRIGRETIRISFDFSGASGDLSRSSLLTLNKNTGGVEILPLTHSGTNDGYVDIRLSAGDPILLKYDNGMAFALR
jgi:hypothetical protein